MSKDKKQPEAPKVKASAFTRFGRAERRSLSNAGRDQAGLKPDSKGPWGGKKK